jgi:hypothetical protein
MHEPADLADPSRHLESIWRSLALAARTVDSPLRTPTLATADLDGSPDARTVVLRSAEAQSRAITLYTDARSPKVQQLEAEPRAALSFWDAASQVQLRIRGKCRRVDDAAAAEAWTGVPEHNRLNYRRALPPGSVVSGFDAVEHVAGDGVENFALLVFVGSEIDWLWLDRAGHKRCRFDLSATPATRQWIVP